MHDLRLRLARVKVCMKVKPHEALSTGCILSVKRGLPQRGSQEAQAIDTPRFCPPFPSLTPIPNNGPEPLIPDSNLTLPILPSHLSLVKVSAAEGRAPARWVSPWVPPSLVWHKRR